MAQKLYNDTSVQDIADAIREKNGEPATTKYKIGEMGAAIRAIPSGGEKPTVIDGQYLFAGFRKNLIGKVKVNTDNITGMFSGNSQVSKEDIVSVFEDTDNVFRDTNGFISLFSGCRNITEFDTSILPFLNPNSSSSAIVLNQMFQNCTALKNATVKSGKQDGSLYTKYVSNMFDGCSLLESVDLSKVKILTTADSTAKFMFYNCKNLANITFDESTSNEFCPKDIASMFRGCTGLTNFETGIFNYLIGDCGYMFNGCTNLRKVKIPNFCFDGTASLASMASMFSGCTSLETIDIGWYRGEYTRSVYNTTSMFANCTSLQNLVIRNTGGVCRLSASNAFTGVPADCKIYVPDNLVSAYKSATNWSARASQIYPLSQYVES